MTALLVIICVAFISLGLPDSIMGSAWPAIIKLRNESLIRGGQVVLALGALLLMLPLPANLSALGFVLFGLGTAPIFPAMLRETPRRFGEAASGAVMGLQMAVAYYRGDPGPAPLLGLWPR